LAKKAQKYEEKFSELNKETQRLDETVARQTAVISELKFKSSGLIKENEKLRTNIKFLEINGGMRESIGMSRAPVTMNQMNGGNFGMEDEPGEEFNNTYLLELKTGESQMSLDKNNALSHIEIQKRNSMYPQHMRASHVMYGLDSTEQEIKVNLKLIFSSQFSLNLSLFL
jgi:hypothetical protein